MTVVLGLSWPRSGLLPVTVTSAKLSTIFTPHTDFIMNNTGHNDWFVQPKQVKTLWSTRPTFTCRQSPGARPGTGSCALDVSRAPGALVKKPAADTAQRFKRLLRLQGKPSSGLRLYNQSPIKLKSWLIKPTRTSDRAVTVQLCADPPVGDSEAVCQKMIGGAAISLLTGTNRDLVSGNVSWSLVWSNMESLWWHHHELVSTCWP